MLESTVDDFASVKASRGRRYRYYVSQLAIKNLSDDHSGPSRVPAHELEARITEKLLAFLKSDADVFDRLRAEDESPASIKSLVVAAKKLASRLPSLPSNGLRDLLGSFLRRVVLGENSIQVKFSRKELRLLLENGGKNLAGQRGRAKARRRSINK